MMVRTGAIFDMRTDCTVYRFEASDGKKVTVCNLPVPHILKNQRVDLFALADQAADQIKAEIAKNELPRTAE
jgi:hypothetical protein